MDKLRIATTECNYKGINRQLKKQFILNDRNMTLEITKELTKIEENDNMTSEQVLAWARKAEALTVQSAILENLNETEDFNKIFAKNRVQRRNGMQL